MVVIYFYFLYDISLFSLAIYIFYYSNAYTLCHIYLHCHNSVGIIIHHKIVFEVQRNCCHLLKEAAHFPTKYFSRLLWRRGRGEGWEQLYSFLLSWCCVMFSSLAYMTPISHPWHLDDMIYLNWEQINIASWPQKLLESTPHLRRLRVAANASGKTEEN